MGRFLGPGQILGSGTTGRFSLYIDLTSLPQPMGQAVALPGETWRFQAWYRDANPLSTSNFTDALRIEFR